MTIKSKILVVTGTFVLGASIGWFARPAKVITRTEIQIVEKIVHDKDTDIKARKKVVIVENKNPDGTVTKTTTIEDAKDTTIKEKTVTDSKTDSKSEKIVEYDRPSWLLAGKYGINLQGERHFGASIDRRLVGPIYIGGYGFSDGRFGASVGLQF